MTALAAERSASLRVSPFQARVLATDERTCLALTGGRGGGKTRGAALLVLRHVGQYGAAAKVLWLRQSHRGVADAQAQLLEVLGEAYGRSGFSLNANLGLFTFDTGASIELNQLQAAGDYRKFQGRSFTKILPDEATQWATPNLLDRMRSNLRGPLHVPTRVVLLANPGDVGHGWIAKRHAQREPWVPYAEDWSDDTRKWITAPSTLDDNPFIDRDSYRRELSAACADDPELLRAWVEGDWSVVRGSYFGDCISDAVALDGCTPEWYERESKRIWYMGDIPIGRRFGQTYLAHDFGSAAPSVTYVVHRVVEPLPVNDRIIPVGSFILLDELAAVAGENLNEGKRQTIPEQAREIVALADKWGIRPEGAADDAIFAKHGHEDGTIADEFKKHGVYFRPAHKGGRVDGWQRMRSLLRGAGQPDVPGLYVSRECRYFFETVPYLQRDPRRREDLDTTGPDHAADACRMALTGEPLGRAFEPDRSLVG